MGRASASARRLDCIGEAWLHRRSANSPEILESRSRRVITASGAPDDAHVAKIMASTDWVGDSRCGAMMAGCRPAKTRKHFVRQILVPPMRRRGSPGRSSAELFQIREAPLRPRAGHIVPLQQLDEHLSPLELEIVFGRRELSGRPSLEAGAWCWGWTAKRTSVPAQHPPRRDKYIVPVIPSELNCGSQDEPIRRL